MSAPLVRTYTEAVPALAAAATDQYVICEAPFAGSVSMVSYTPDTDIVGANTNSRTLNLINKGQDGNGTTVVATLALVSGVNINDFDERELTLSATPANLVVAPGDILVFQSQSVGTGIADPGGTVQLELSRT